MVRHWTELTPDPSPGRDNTADTKSDGWRQQSERARRTRENAELYWPQLLRREQAVAYVGLPERVFDQQIRPLLKARRFGKSIYFYRRAIDDVLDQFWGSPAPVPKRQERTQHRNRDADLRKQEQEIERIIEEM